MRRLLAVRAAGGNITVWLEGALLGNVLLGEEEFSSDVAGGRGGFDNLPEGGGEYPDRAYAIMASEIVLSDSNNDSSESAGGL